MFVVWYFIYSVICGLSFIWGNSYGKDKCKSQILCHFRCYNTMMDVSGYSEEYKKGARDVFEGIWHSCEFDEKELECLKKWQCWL